MPTTYRIPKFTDREIVDALLRVRAALDGQIGFDAAINVPQRGDVNLSDANAAATLNYLFDAQSEIAQRFRLNSEQGEALTIERKPSDVTDAATIPDQWAGGFRQQDPNNFPQRYASFVAAVRKEFRVGDAEAAMKVDGDSEWNRYRAAQAATLDGLQSAAKNLMIEAAKNAAVLDAQRAERFENLESTLRAELQKQREGFQAEFDTKKAEVETREKAAADRETDFNTKESHFVARQKQDAQIQEVKEWLKTWQLTKGTSAKRNPVLAAYIVGIVGTACAAIYSIKHSYDILKTADDVLKLAWWQTLTLAAKAMLPFALCVSFVVYFIRWASAWARQHSDEEFRNRTLLIDIGRAGWLLEAVRDAQVRKAVVPEILLKELSRNLFTFSSNSEGEIQPQTAADMLMQGFSKLRVKQSADGTEVEAARGK